MGSHLVFAPDALSAINLVEMVYCRPVRPEKTFIENEAGQQREVTIADNWHGFMFEAHATEAAPTSVTQFRPILIPYTEV